MVKKNIYLIPLLILIITAVYAIYIVSITDIVFGYKQYLGFLSITLNIVISFFRKDLSIYFTGLILVIGALNIIAFTPAIEAYSFGFGFNDAIRIDFKVQLFSFLLLILYLMLNVNFLRGKLKHTDNNKAAH